MSWTKIAPAQPRIACLSIRVTSVGYDGVPHVVIRIARDFARQAELPSDEKGRVDVWFGDGADAGRMKIDANADGDHAAHPQGKQGALKIAFKAPDNVPAEFEPQKGRKVEPAIEGAGVITFLLPWHKRAADRVVEEIPQVSQDDAGAYRVHSGTSVEKFIRENAPPTLDAIEEEARPARATVITVTQADLDAHFDAPVNGSAKAHVYADSPTGIASKPFVHKDRTVALEPREHAVATKLYKAMKAAPPGSFIDFGILSRAAETRDIDVLHTVMTRLTEKLETIGLVVNVKKKMGYWLKEMEES